MNKADTVMLYMLRRPAIKHFSATDLSNGMGIALSNIHGYLSALLGAERICRAKINGSARWSYFMTDVQKAAFRLRVAKFNVLTLDELQGLPGSAPGDVPTEPFIPLITDTHEIRSRLTYLENIKEKTIFGGHDMLNKIITDYRRTLNMRLAAEARLEAAA